MIRARFLPPLSSVSGLSRLLFGGAVLALVHGAAPVAQAQETAPDDRYVWNLTDLYETPDAWQAEYDRIKGEMDGLAAYKGTLGKNAPSLLKASDSISGIYKEAVRLLVYATLKADEDTRIPTNEERRQLAQALLADLGEAVSWFNPEILKVGDKRIKRFLDREEGLAKHRFSLEDVLRRGPHTLGDEAEQVMAATAVVTNAPSGIYNIFANADMPWPELKLSSETVPGGEPIRLSQSAYTRYRSAANRADRKAVFDAFWGTWADYENTLGTVLNAHIRSLNFATKARKHETSLGRSLFDDNMPESVYRTLVDEVNEALPTLHRYFRLRTRMLKIEDGLRYYDIYPPLVQLDKTFTIEDSIALTREALRPLGEEYLADYNGAIEGGWMHVYPQEGKRAGAYMFGSAYDVHPYVLLNHNDDYESMSTFAHEYGHAVHSVLANKVQPFETANYSTFVAETAAIMNEMLLQDYMVANAEDPKEKLYYLGNGLESLRGTFFRQTMFAEFELAINEMVERGEVLTGSKLTTLYLGLLKKYHGHDQGVMTIDDAYAIEWAYIPHFYYDFYVYQYATSIAAAADLATQIGAGSAESRDAFITMLKAGGSDFPYTLMKATGVDLATEAPYEALEARMNAIMDEMEKLLDQIEE